ncbi:hypothetical protein EV426DRAFT_613026 [Tirmania nivea]|nr:hypothetical protein EV426DRAFT_613026 [Tirmania nivea]
MPRYYARSLLKLLLGFPPWLPLTGDYWAQAAQLRPSGTAETSPLLECHNDTRALKAQVDRLTSQRDSAVHMLAQLEDLANTIYPAYQRLSLHELRHIANCPDDRESLLYKFYQTTVDLLSDVERKQERISALTSNILRLSDTRVEANRDDYYFAGKFAGVFRAVDEWVYLTFLDADIEQELEQDAVNLFRDRAGPDWERCFKEEHLELLTSVVTQMIVSKVLEPPFLGMRDPCVALVLPAIAKSLKENNEEDVKWRARTIHILTSSPIFWEKFQPTADSLANGLLTTFSCLTQKKTAHRIKKLASLIKEGGLVTVECQMEPSQFRFHDIPPGTRCYGDVANMVSDARNRLKDQELEGGDGKWVIVMTVSPAVLRIAYGSGRVVVVLKAKVTLEELIQEADMESKSSKDSGSSDGGNGSSDELIEETDSGDESSNESGSSHEEDECSDERGGEGGVNDEDGISEEKGTH